MTFKQLFDLLYRLDTKETVDAKVYVKVDGTTDALEMLTIIMGEDGTTRIILAGK